MRCSGTLGFVSHSESDSSPGIYIPVTTTISFRGTKIRRYKGWSQANNTIVGNLVNGDSIQFYASSGFSENLGNLRWLQYNGSEVKWVVTSIETDRYPTITVGLGEVYRE